jgi:hypothetical protein
MKYIERKDLFKNLKIYQKQKGNILMKISQAINAIIITQKIVMKKIELLDIDN